MPIAVPSGPVSSRHAGSSTDEIGEALEALGRGSTGLTTMTVARRRQLVEQCVAGVAQHAREWVELSCEAKGIPTSSHARAEEVMAGPLVVLRHLHLIRQTLVDVEQWGHPRLPVAAYRTGNQLRVPVFPTANLYDSLIFRPIRAVTWMQSGVEPDNLFGGNVQRLSGAAKISPRINLVLGAGNVSSIPITDALTKLIQESQSVLLKMNPVNDYLGPIFENALAPLMAEDTLRIVYGDGAVGGQLVAQPAVTDIHITGSDKTHDAIVWGRDSDEQSRRKIANEPLLTKPITSELGNVSPWIVVPGQYTRRQLYFQAENIVASIANNASFNCVATKMLITCRDWPRREALLDQIESILSTIPARAAFYPGAGERFARFTNSALIDGDTGTLPWSLLRDVTPAGMPHLFAEESFTCVCGETALNASNECEFLDRAVDFANERLWGTLSAGMTVTSSLQNSQSAELDEAISKLRYGTIGVNQWPGVAFALMSTPWGGFPSKDPRDVQSGAGTVHNTYLLDRPEKTVLSSPLTISPKPMWFSTHRRPEALAWRMVELYSKPAAWKIVPVIANALRG